MAVPGAVAQITANAAPSATIWARARPRSRARINYTSMGSVDRLPPILLAWRGPVHVAPVRHGRVGDLVPGWIGCVPRSGRNCQVSWGYTGRYGESWRPWW